ncbi:MAG TPA: hypothetical protein V6D20_13405 [Candidatus Obscuribacterales bacterium]
MPSAEMTRFMDQTRIRLPGAIDSVILMEFFSTMKEFLGSTNIWQEIIPFNIVAATGDPTIDPTDFTYTVSPTSGAINRLITVLNDAGKPVSVTMATPGEIVIMSPQTEAQTLYAKVALTVIDPVAVDGDYPVFPDWIIGKYKNEIMDGLLGRMMTQIAKPYSSASTGIVHLKRFRSAISTARTEATKTNLYGAQRWRFPKAFT